MHYPRTAFQACSPSWNVWQLICLGVCGSNCTWTPCKLDCSGAWKTWVWPCLISIGGMQRASSLISPSKWRSALQTGDPSGHKPCRRHSGGTAANALSGVPAYRCNHIQITTSRHERKILWRVWDSIQILHKFVKLKRFLFDRCCRCYSCGNFKSKF